MKLILTRHGETEENVKRISQGQTHGTLSKKGTGQAKKLALRFKGEKIDAIYSSDLGRAVNTVKEVSKYHPHLEINYTELLRERDIKEFAGKKCSEVDWYDETGKVESDKQLKERAKKLIDSIYEKHSNDTVLLLGHGGINAAIMSIIMCRQIGEVFDMVEWQNTNVTIFEFDENKNHKIHCLNCTKHLEQNN